MAKATARKANGSQAAPTMRDVAREAGVAVGTVSRVLSGQGRFRPETHDRIQAAAEKIGYRPNDLFRGLLRGRSSTVGLISSDTYGRFTMPILDGIEQVLGEAGMSVFLASAAEDPRREQRHIEAFLAKRVEGLIVTASRTDARPPVDVGNLRIPIVYAYTQIADPRAPCLLPDDTLGASLAVEHLLRLGRKRFAHISGPSDHEAVRLRAAAAHHVLGGAGLELADTHVLYGPWHAQWGREAAQRLFAHGRDLDAVFCGNDEIAWGVLNALAEAGVSVPDDVAVVGYDNWAIPNEAVRPPLTSVDMKLFELGCRAGTRLLALIDGEPGGGAERVPTRLVVRRSCGGELPPATV